VHQCYFDLHGPQPAADEDDVASAIEQPQLQTPTATCFGYAARSSVKFSACRLGTGVALDVSESDRPIDPGVPPLLEWHEDYRPFARLWDDAPRFQLWIDGIGWYEIDRRGPSITIPSASSGLRREARLWGVPAALCFMDRGDLPLHAASVDIGGAAVVLAAPGRYGKTTLAAACMQAGHRLLSEDLTCVTTSPSAAVWPGPALMRVRKDVFARLSFPGADVVDEDETRMYVMPNEVARGSGAAVPLRAVVLLRKCDEPDVELTRVEDPAEALRDLWTLSFNLPNDADRTRCFGTIAQLAAAVPVWNLARPLTYESLPRVIAALERFVV
jgi:hypothetical protein